jgi:hypothetical protein
MLEMLGKFFEKWYPKNGFEKLRNKEGFSYRKSIEYILWPNRLEKENGWES